MTPTMAHAVLESTELLSAATRTFDELCVRWVTANEARCKESVEQSLAMVTALSPVLGNDEAATLVKEALLNGKTSRDICLERKVVPDRSISQLLNAESMTAPRE